MRQDAHRALDSQMLSPIAGGLAGHSDLGNVGALSRALARWAAKQEPIDSGFAKRGQNRSPRSVSEAEYKAARTEKNNKRTLEKWGVDPSTGNVAELRAQEQAKREQAAKAAAAAEFTSRVAALPEHIVEAYDINMAHDHPWQRLSTAEFCASLSAGEQATMLERRRAARKPKRK